MSAPVMVLRFGRVGSGIAVTLWLLIPAVESTQRKDGGKTCEQDCLWQNMLTVVQSGKNLLVDNHRSLFCSKRVAEIHVQKWTSGFEAFIRRSKEEGRHRAWDRGKLSRFALKSRWNSNCHCAPEPTARRGREGRREERMLPYVC